MICAATIQCFQNAFWVSYSGLSPLLTPVLIPILAFLSSQQFIVVVSNLFAVEDSAELLCLKSVAEKDSAELQTASALNIWFELDLQLIHPGMYPQSLPQNFQHLWCMFIGEYFLPHSSDAVVVGSFFSSLPSGFFFKLQSLANKNISVCQVKNLTSIISLWGSPLKTGCY